MTGQVQILPAQLRAARALLGWSLEDLAERVALSQLTLADFEAAPRPQGDRVLAQIRRALEAGGVAFIESDDGGYGVRLRGEAPAASDAAATIPLERLNAENDE